jgi:hypothetical protein
MGQSGFVLSLNGIKAENKRQWPYIIEQYFVHMGRKEDKL